MPATHSELLPILIGIFFVASVIQSSSGFGFGIFSVAALSLLAHRFGLTMSTPMLAILNAPVIMYVLWRLRGHVRLTNLGPILVGLLVGIPIGTTFLVRCPQEILLRVLAVVLLYAAVRAAMPNGDACDPDAAGGQRETLARKIGGLGIGMASGALAGAFNTGGPPVIAYVYCRPWSKEQRTATLQAIFIVSIFARIVYYSCVGLYDVPLLLTTAACLPAAIAGMFFGYALFRKFPPRALEIFVAVFLSLVAIKLLIWT